MTAPPAVLVAHQPAYLPWPGYFSRLLDVDELVVLDHVQFSERGRQHRNVVRGAPGSAPLRLTVPVRRSFGQPISQVELADEPWADRHWRTLVERYAKAPFWPDHQERLAGIYARPWTHLAPLAEALTHFLLDGFGLKVHLTPSSRLAPSGARTDMLINLCLERGATALRTGTGALGYLNQDQLAHHGIRLEVATYTHPPYGADRRGWVPGLSALDLLLHEGPNAIHVLRAGARTKTKGTAR
ncbi:WbqC family protein [Kitasatospora sp. NPDC050463]|uniref:WbqC family protein n=1 Tax=Kitasatospora sp. NPDC050463 TaxID=3155786 RepID=UPI00340B914E